MELNTRFLRDLCITPSPSGCEYMAVDCFEKECQRIIENNELKNKNIPFKITRDAVGNSIVKIGNGDTKIMISAHIDEIGLQVQYIDDDGFIHFVAVGGVDRKVLLGSSVVVLGTKLINGVIGKVPIHIEYDDKDAKDKVTDIVDMKIDCGFSNKEEANMYVNVGDLAIISADSFMSPDGYRFFARGIDDKSGIFCCTEILRKLLRSERTGIFDYITLYVVACTQEETGADGAKVATKEINPDYSIDFDVTFATDDGNVKKEEWGDIKLGKGGCIAFGVDKNRELSKKFVDICEKYKIPYQPFAVQGGGTNTKYIKTYSLNPNIQTILLSIPQRNMHTQVEVCDLRDIQSLVDMTSQFILTRPKPFKSPVIEFLNFNKDAI